MESGKRYVEFMGGADNVVSKARESFERASTAGLRKCSDTSSSPIPPIRRPANCRPTPSSTRLPDRIIDPAKRLSDGCPELRHGTPSFPIGGTASEDSIGR